MNQTSYKAKVMAKWCSCIVVQVAQSVWKLLFDTQQIFPMLILFCICLYLRFRNPSSVFAVLIAADASSCKNLAIASLPSAMA